ncbi:hypothetical protein B7494_g2958 [Chlorociboria aeruginascens]|nr:hypothetical protein B7494_g2958 [Chlorociboria aeruginascens]
MRNVEETVEEKVVNITLEIEGTMKMFIELRGGVLEVSGDIDKMVGDTTSVEVDMDKIEGKLMDIGSGELKIGGLEDGLEEMTSLEPGIGEDEGASTVKGDADVSVEMARNRMGEYRNILVADPEDID